MSHNFSLCDIYWGLQNYKNIKKRVFISMDYSNSRVNILNC